MGSVRNPYGTAAAACLAWREAGLDGEPIALPGYDLIYVHGCWHGWRVLAVFSDRFICVADRDGVYPPLQPMQSRLRPHHTIRPGPEDE